MGRYRLPRQALLANGTGGEDQDSAAQARRARTRRRSPMCWGLTINYAERRVTMSGHPVHLTVSRVWPALRALGQCRTGANP